MQTFSVVIPVVNQRNLTRDLLYCISINLVKPKEIILIDNNSSEDIESLVSEYRNLNIVYLKQDRNIGVNASWNLGIRLAKGSILSILNNDIIISKFFFECTQKVMDSDPEIGICVPFVSPDKTFVLTLDEELSTEVVDGCLDAGCAINIRTKIAKDCYPIPKVLKTFWGDRYLFDQACLCGFRLVTMTSNPVYHYGGVTQRSVFLGQRNLELMEKEEKIYNKKVKIEDLW